MPTRNKILFAVLFLGIIAAAIYAGLQLKRDNRATAAPPPYGGLECGQWTVYRTCEIMGIPISPQQIVQKIPAGPEGNSLKSIADALNEVGLSTHGLRQDFDTFLGENGTRIVHLKSPEHFIVVQRVSGNKVFFLDHQGRRQVSLASTVRDHWTGNVLMVSRPADPKEIRHASKKEESDSPQIQFNTLFIDQGDIVSKADTKSIRFEFPFQNVGKKDLAIKKVRTSCTCLESTKPEEAVKPGETGSIVLNYRMTESSQPFLHEAVVETNDPEFPAIILRAAGNTNILVNVSPSRLAFGETYAGQSRQTYAIIRYTGEENFSVQSAACAHDSVTVRLLRELDDELKQRLFPGATNNLGGAEFFVLEATLSPIGVSEVSTNVEIKTNVKGYEQITIPVSAKVLPPIRSQPAILDIPVADAKATITQSLVLKSVDGQSLKVKDIASIPNDISWTTEQQADDSATIRFSGSYECFRALAGQDLNVVVEVHNQSFTIKIPVYVYQ